MKVKALLFLVFFSLWLNPLISFSQEPTPASASYAQQMRALQAAFCGYEQQEDLLRKVKELVAAHLEGMDPATRDKLHPDHVVEAVMTTLHSTFHVDELCFGHSQHPWAKAKGIGFGLGLGLAFETYGVNTAIHELGHAANHSMCWCHTSTEINVVKFQVLATFLRDLFNGHADLAMFGDLINPFSGIGQGGTLVKGWMTPHFTAASHLSSLGVALGSNGAQTFMLLGGVMYTSLAQISGIIIGLSLRHRNPVLGYTMITASVTGYALELINWLALSLAPASSVAGSDIARAAALLGVAPTVISGVMIGASAAAVITYVAVSTYLKHLKELRLSAQSLVEEGFLEALHGDHASVLEELFAAYPRKQQFEERLEKLKDHIQQTSKARLEVAVRGIEKALLHHAELQEQGKGDGAAYLSDKLPESGFFARLRAQFKQYRKVKKFTDELKSFHTYIANSKTTIAIDKQDGVGNQALRKILAGKFSTVPKQVIFDRPTSFKERSSLVDAYLQEHENVSMGTLVRANVKRLKFNEELMKDASIQRWKQLISKEEFATLKEIKGRWFSIKHILYHNYIFDLSYDLEVYLEKFGRSKVANNRKEMEKITKDLLKQVLLVPKEQRDIPATMDLLNHYSDAIQAQDRVRLQKHWGLDIVDKASCMIEIKFLCSLGKIFHEANLPLSSSYRCPLKAPNSCYELSEGAGIVGPAPAAVPTA